MQETDMRKAVANRTGEDDCADLENLINECGYRRRDEKLAAAKRHP